MQYFPLHYTWPMVGISLIYMLVLIIDYINFKKKNQLFYKKQKKLDAIIIYLFKKSK